MSDVAASGGYYISAGANKIIAEPSSITGSIGVVAGKPVMKGLYDWLGKPYRTQQVVRRALTQLYPDTVGGFPGNDDLGTLSAWYVFSALGIYPAVPGTDVLALATPIFRDVTLHLAAGDVRLRAPQAGPGAPYIQSLTVQGNAYSRAWIRLSELHAGTTLDYALSATPNPAWGAAPADVPPSFAPSAASGCASVAARTPRMAAQHGRD